METRGKCFDFRQSNGVAQSIGKPRQAVLAIRRKGRASVLPGDRVIDQVLPDRYAVADRVMNVDT